MSRNLFSTEKPGMSTIDNPSILSMYGEPTNGETVLQQMEKYISQEMVVDTSLHLVDVAIEEIKNHLRELLLLQNHIQTYKWNEKSFLNNMQIRLVLNTVARTQWDVWQATKSILEYQDLMRLKSPHHKDLRNPTPTNLNEDLQERDFKEMLAETVIIIEDITQRLQELDSILKISEKHFFDTDGFTVINLVLIEIWKLFQEEFKKYTPITRDLPSYSTTDLIKWEFFNLEIKDPAENILDTFEYCQEILTFVIQQSIDLKNQVVQIKQWFSLNTSTNKIQMIFVNETANKTLNCIAQTITKIKNEMTSKWMKIPSKNH